MKQMVSRLRKEIYDMIKNEGIVAVALDYGIDTSEYTEEEIAEKCIAIETENSVI
jgi:hypothetical protein